MNLRRVLLGTLCCLALACGESRPGGVPIAGPCIRDTDCMSPFACRDGLCQVPPEKLCTPDKTRCNGDAVETCSASGDAWVKSKDCSIGCIPGDAPDCAPQVCTPNERKCDGQFVLQCLDTGAAWVTLQTCPTACSNTSGTVECAARICTPFETRCKDGATVETCNSRGTLWEPAPCQTTGTPEQVCAANRCQTKVCDAGKSRCRGNIAETCNADGTAYEDQEVCRYACELDGDTAVCPVPVCTPFATRCTPSGLQVETCNPHGTAWVASACDLPSGEGRCVGGSCHPKLCSAGQERCAGASRERCDATETKWETIEACTFGCNVGSGVSSCRPPACAAGEARCDNLNLLVCAPDRASFTLSRYCASGCVPNGATTPPSATCAVPRCAPQSRQCGTETGTGRTYVELCRADGTGHERVETCPGACSNGVCTITADTCTPGETRCKGAEVETCVASGNTTRWEFVERCLERCGGGTCVDGGAATAFSLTPILPPATEETPNPTVACDGASTVLFHTSVVQGAAGATVADGTLVTFTHDGPDSLLASADADPAAAGLQRPTLHGRAVVRVRAPSSCATPRTLTVTASFGGRAVGTGTATFETLPEGAVKQVLFSEDFSTIEKADLTQTSATWDVTVGALTAQPTFDPGTGIDGDLTVAAGQTVVLSNGYARLWDVLAFGQSDVTVATVLPTLSPGDEVLLATVNSDSATFLGTFETKRVASVATGRVVFTEPVRETFSRFGNGDLSGHRIVMQRVPQFRNVTIADTGVLTTAPQSTATGAGTGILAMRVSDTLRVLGRIDMNDRGRPAGVGGPNVAPTAAINKLLPGYSTAGAAGGGVVWVNTRRLLFKTTANVVAPGTALIQARGGAAAGTIWVAAGTHEYGTTITRLDVTGGTLAGRVRLDWARLDNQTTPATPGGQLYFGQRGASTVQTVRLFEETDANLDIVRATLLGLLAGTSSTDLVVPTVDNGGLASILPSVNLRASADDGATYGIIDAGSVTFNSNGTSPSIGKRLRVKGTLSTDDSQPLRVRGAVLLLDVQ